MNWELKAGYKDTVQDLLAGKFAKIMSEGIERFAHQLGTKMDFITASDENLGPNEHGPSEFSEFPEGFFHEGPSYCYRLNVGFYEGGKFVSMNPPEYNVTITRLGEQRGPSRFLRKREIKNAYPIS